MCNGSIFTKCIDKMIFNQPEEVQLNVSQSLGKTRIEQNGKKEKGGFGLLLQNS